jgi:hypothetical protein
VKLPEASRGEFCSGFVKLMMVGYMRKKETTMNSQFIFQNSKQSADITILQRVRAPISANMKKRILPIVCTLVMAIVVLQPSQSLSFSTCDDGSQKDLEKSIELHNEHVYRMNRKIVDIWYHWGHIPEKYRKKIKLENICDFLVKLSPRKTAVIFHARGANSLSSWLITYKREIISMKQPLRKSELDVLQPKLWQTLGVRGSKNPRLAFPIDNKGFSDKEPTINDWDLVLKPISKLLFPEDVVNALLDSKIDTLIVVPITIREFDPLYDLPEKVQENMSKEFRLNNVPMSDGFVLSLGTIPFAALPIKDKRLVDLVSVVIAPGFFIFAQDPLQARKNFSDPIVVGDPVNKDFKPLPGARQEAKDVAHFLKVEALYGDRATKETVESILTDHAKTVDLIHLATHGVANSKDPLDKSYLVLSDSLWTARQISKFRQSEKAEPVFKNHPLIVMSACQTALGKDFSVGTIGLARAWHWVGASNVVMSLWSVDDCATQKLMTDFIRLKANKPTDKALQEAMQLSRESDDNPANWASFGIFGKPELLIRD